VANILNHPPFKAKPSHFPHPLRGLFTSIGHALKFVLGGFLGWVYQHVLLKLGHGFSLAFGSWWPYVLAVLAIVVGALAGYFGFRRRTRLESTDIHQRAASARQDPEELERLAEAAAAAGDFASAVKLWYQAGVLRLTLRGSITSGPMRTDAQLVSELPSATLAALANRHAQIVYGRQRATSDDAQRAREGWRVVVNESTRSLVAS
jgi:Domain of unknown function (DUF4129)